MLTRRALLLSTAPVALSAAGCSASFQAGLNAAANTAYTELVTVAKILEAAISKAATDIKTAYAMIQPYIVPCCRIIESMDTLAQTLVANGTLKPSSGSKLSTALGGLHTAATTSIIAQTASTGMLPSDPVTIATDIIQVAALIVSASSSKVTPVAAVAA